MITGQVRYYVPVCLQIFFVSRNIKKLDNSLTFLILFEDIRPDGYLASQYLEHPYNSTSNHESHHGCSESQGLELFHILLPVLRTIVRYIEDLFAQFSKPAIFFKKLMLNK